MRPFALAGLLLALGAVPAVAPARVAPKGALLERVRWLAGCWEQRAGGRVTLEMWMPPDGGLMIGGSRTTIGARTREYEHLRLAEVDDRLVYTALPSGQREASFTSVQVTDSGFAVENRQHDFPQRIEYRSHGSDSLVARIEGPGREPGSTRGVSFAMHRVSCHSP